MSNKFVRRSVDTTIENNIVTAAIISSKYMEEIYNLYNPQYLKNAFAKTVMRWVFDYFEKFGESPKHHIKNIFDIEKGHLDDAELEIIQVFLDTLSRNYVEDQGVNDEYILDQSMQYFRKREVEIRVDNAQKLISVGKLDLAEDELFKMKKVVRITSNWSNPFDTDKIHEVFDEKSKGIFRFPGAMGDLFGDLERGWFIAYMAPFKRGKTWALQEACVVAALSGLKTVFISLEMQDKNINERIYKRITAFGAEGTKSQVLPVFDCVKNQFGMCEKDIRVNQHTLMEPGEDPPEYVEDMRYRPCSVCRGMSKDSGFELATWYETMNKKEFTAKNVNKKLKSFKRFYGDNIRIKCYPRFAASISDIKRDLDILEQTEGFIPDVIVIDYADILRPDGRGTSSEPRHGLDEIWKNLASMAMERHCILFSASQGNRGSIYKPNIDQADLAEWIGKLGHVDVFAALNQSGEEKKKGVMRIGLLAHRHAEFHEKDNATVLQSLSLGQVHLDSYFERG